MSTTSSNSTPNLQNLPEVVLTEIPGLGTVHTWGPIKFHRVEVLKDASIIDEKRDRFNTRNAFLNAVAETGFFEYNLVRAPNGPAGRVAKCVFCGSLHNWCVLYKHGERISWSGTDCFAEVCHNLKLPAADAMILAVNQERTRCERFVKTLAKVTDFKRDFPGLYEHREAFDDYSANPYRNLWSAAMNRLDAAEGVDEKWLAECLDGTAEAYSATAGRRRGVFRRHLRPLSQAEKARIPQFLKWSSEAIRASNVGEVLARLRAEAAAEAGKRNPPPQAVHIPAPAKPLEIVKQMAQELLDTGAYDWSPLTKRAAAGDELTSTEIQVIRTRRATLRRLAVA